MASVMNLQYFRLLVADLSCGNKGQLILSWHVSEHGGPHLPNFDYLHSFMQYFRSPTVRQGSKNSLTGSHYRLHLRP